MAPGVLVAVVAIALAGRSAEAPGARGAAGAAAIASAPSGGDSADDPPDRIVPLVNKFTIDDTLPGWAAPDRGSSRRSRRLGGLSNYRTDPYER